MRYSTGSALVFFIVCLGGLVEVPNPRLLSNTLRFPRRLPPHRFSRAFSSTSPGFRVRRDPYSNLHSPQNSRLRHDYETGSLPNSAVFTKRPIPDKENTRYRNSNSKDNENPRRTGLALPLAVALSALGVDQLTNGEEAPMCTEEELHSLQVKFQELLEKRGLRLEIRGSPDSRRYHFVDVLLADPANNYRFVAHAAASDAYIFNVAAYETRKDYGRIALLAVMLHIAEKSNYCDLNAADNGSGRLLEYYNQQGFVLTKQRESDFHPHMENRDLCATLKRML